MRETETERRREGKTKREIDGINKAKGKYKKRTKRKEMVRKLAKERKSEIDFRDRERVKDKVR